MSQPKNGLRHLVSQPGFFLEDFEACAGSPDFAFPEGWITSPNPLDAGDLWRVGSLTRDGDLMSGASGIKYAFILGTGSTHDAWAVSPAINMESGKDYDISFYTVMFSGDVFEGFDVVVLPSQNIAATPLAQYTLSASIDTNGIWQRFSETFTPPTSGNYYIGIHSNAGGSLNFGTVIDDLRVTHGSYPAFGGDTWVEFETKGSMDAYAETIYEFFNSGDADLHVSFESLTDGIEIMTPEVVVEPFDYGEAMFRLTTTDIGPFTGYVRVTTDDPSAKEFIIKATATVSQSRISGYSVEDFESGGPEGWDLCMGSANTADFGGRNGSSRAFYTTSYYTLLPGNEEGVGFRTHYIDMGDAPVFKFWYRLFNSDLFGTPSGTTASDVPRIKVMVTADYGMTWDEAYVIEPGGAHVHKAVDTYQEVSMELPQYAGKTCRFRVLFSHASGDIMDAMMNTFTALVDDVVMGTPVPQDIKAGYLTGATSVVPGTANNYTVSVTNAGVEPLSESVVNLTDCHSGAVLESITVPALQPGASQDVTFSWAAPAAGSYTLKAVAVNTEDKQPGNDWSNNLYVAALPEGNTAVTVNQGKKTYSQSMPVSFYSVQSEVQSLYYANEIGMTKGALGSVTIFARMNSEYMSESFEVYVAETDREDFSDNKFEPYQNMTKVFEGAAYFPAGDSEFVIPFDKPFDYNGGNLLVCMRKIGNEFINNKTFLARESKIARTILAGTEGQVTLEDKKTYYPSTATAIAQMRFNLLSAPAGSVSGTVTDSKGAVKDAKVGITGTNIYTMTDGAGTYSLTGVAQGSCNLEVSHHGYYVNAVNPVTVAKDANTVKDVQITELPRYTVSGVVTSQATSEPLAGVCVELKGYDDFMVNTDAAGRYEINGVCGEKDFDYILRTSDGYFDAFARTVAVEGDLTSDVAMTETILPASNVAVVKESDEIKVTWERPVPSVRYDSGLRKGCLGYPHGWREVIMGQAVRQPMVIEEVRFFVTDEEGAHTNFNIIILGLKADGTPDGQNVLYDDYDIEFVDNEWTTYRLIEPLAVNGCLVAISCNGFLGLGMTPSSPEYPFEAGTYYYAGEAYSSQLGIWDMANSTYNSNLMIRTYGYTLDSEGEPIVNPRSPSGGYKVCRLPYREENPAAWTTVAQTADTFAYDNTVFEDGKYCYAVVAQYQSGEAEAILSPMVKLSHNGVDSVIDELGIKVDGNTIIAPDGAGIFTVAGIKVDGNNLDAGVYVVTSRGKSVKVVIR